MSMTSMKINFSCEQILNLARQLSDDDKLELENALKAETKVIRLKRLLESCSNVNAEISEEEIIAECKAARQELYEKNYKD